MKQSLLTTVILFLFFSASAQFKAGAGVSFQIDGSLLGVVGKGHYTINEDYAGQASFTYFFNEFTVYAIDLDVHYSGFGINLSEFTISPLAGINIMRFGSGYFNASSTNLNLGVSAKKEIGTMELFIEPKLTIGDGSSLNVAAGVYF